MDCSFTVSMVATLDRDFVLAIANPTEDALLLQPLRCSSSCSSQTFAQSLYIVSELLDNSAGLTRAAIAQHGVDHKQLVRQLHLNQFCLVFQMLEIAIERLAIGFHLLGELDGCRYALSMPCHRTQDRCIWILVLSVAWY